MKKKILKIKNILKTKKTKCVEKGNLFEENNNQKDFIGKKQIPVKKRNPGVDFGRILAMYAIVTNHILGSSGFMKNIINIMHYKLSMLHYIGIIMSLFLYLVILDIKLLNIQI